jgi:hypothetical protein
VSVLHRDAELELFPANFLNEEVVRINSTFTVKFRLDESQFHGLFWSIAWYCRKKGSIAKVAGGKCQK